MRLLPLTLCLTTLAAAGGAGGPPSSAENEVRQAYTRLTKATLQQDQAALERLYAPTYQGWGPRLEPQSRAQALMTMPEVSVTEVVVTPRHFEPENGGLAVQAQTRSTVQYKAEGQTQTIRQLSQSRDVWQKVGGMWQMMSSTIISSEVETGGQVQKLVNPAPLSATERQQVRSALATVVQPLSLSGQASNSDLGFLKALAQARVIGVGEGSHGTHEHFLLKARIFKVLAQQYGFTALAFESNMAGGEAVNAYISGQSDDLGAAVAGLGFAVWRNQDVRDLLVWMREYNAGRGAKAPLKFVAIDMQDPAGSARLIQQLTDNTALKAAAQPFVALQPYAIDGQVKDPAVKEKYLAQAAALLQATAALPAQAPRRAEMMRLARTVQQAVLAASGQGARDEYMAENMLAALKANPKEKMMLWAHNGHITRAPEVTPYGHFDLGQRLAKALGADYRTIGQTFAGGQILAGLLQPDGSSGPLQPMRVAPATPDSPEALSTNAPAVALVFADALKNPVLKKYFAVPRPVRGFGASAAPNTMNYLFEVLPQSFDVLLLTKTSTPAKPLP